LGNKYETATICKLSVYTKKPDGKHLRDKILILFFINRDVHIAQTKKETKHGGFVVISFI